jgi:hypothetical protein
LIDFAKSGEKTTRVKALNQLCIDDPDSEELKTILDFVDSYIKKEKDLSILHSLNRILAHFRYYCDRNSKLEFVEKINLLVNRLESLNLEYTLYRWFVGMGVADYSPGDKNVKAKMKDLAIEIPEEIPYDRLGGTINQIFDERGEIPSHSLDFSVSLGENHPKYTMDLVRFFIDNGICSLEKSAFIGGLIKGIEKTEPIEAKSIVKGIYSMKNCWWSVIVRYLFISEVNINKNYSNMLMNIASYGLEETKLLLIKLLGSSLSPNKLGDVPQTMTFINIRFNNLLHGWSKFKRPDMFKS